MTTHADDQTVVKSSLSAGGVDGRRLIAAFIDLVVWTAIWGSTTWAVTEVAYATVAGPTEAGLDPRHGITALSAGVGALCANLYLAVSNGLGQSIGKRYLGLKLVASADHSRTPGLARGLIRSALQAGPWMGALMLYSGAHDTFAGTAIVAAVDRGVTGGPPARDVSVAGRGVSGVPVWKVVLAVVLHAFFAFVYSIVSLL